MIILDILRSLKTASFFTKHFLISNCKDDDLYFKLIPIKINKTFTNIELEGIFDNSSVFLGKFDSKLTEFIS